MSSSKRMLLLSAVLLILIVAWFVSSQKARSGAVPVSAPTAAMGGFSEGASRGAEQFDALNQRLQQVKSAQNVYNPQAATPMSYGAAELPRPVVLSRPEPVKIPKTSVVVKSPAKLPKIPD